MTFFGFDTFDHVFTVQEFWSLWLGGLKGALVSFCGIACLEKAVSQRGCRLFVAITINKSLGQGMMLGSHLARHAEIIQMIMQCGIE